LKSYAITASALSLNVDDVIASAIFVVDSKLKELQPEAIASISGWDYILDALSVSGVF
jgi:hypothetical protein